MNFEQSYSLEPELEQQMAAELSPEALEENEWVQDHPDYILKHREFLYAHPGEVPFLIFVGPSSVGKSVQSGNWARANENDPTVRDHLPLTALGEPKPYFVFHLSLSQGLNAAAQEAGFESKREIVLDESYRRRGTEIMIEGAEMVRRAFTNHPDYNASLHIDTVGITEMDLGTSLVRKYAKDPLSQFVAPVPDARVEMEGLGLRTDAATNPHAIDTVFAKRLVDPGLSFEGRANDFVDSCGDLAAWQRHWEDILRQAAKRNPALAEIDPSVFFHAFAFRSEIYKEWLPLRLAELGINVNEKGKFTWTENDYIPDLEQQRELHVHFDRLNMFEKGKPQNKKRHIPLYLVTGGYVEDISAEDILTELDELPKKGIIYTQSE